MPGPTAYDQVRYLPRPVARMHPAHLAAIARLHGIPAATPTRCRVLEIGTGEAPDLLPLALAYPDSQFLGIDLAQAAIATGQSLQQDAGLTNVELVVADLTTFGEDLGQFDYILARGVFSWVPDPVRDSLLTLCRRLLAPQGVAFISYNVLPGWQTAQQLRQFVRDHTGQIADSVEYARQAKALLQVLHDGSPAAGPLAEAYREEIQLWLACPDEVLYHDELGEYTQAFALPGFVQRARAAGLEYLGDADYFMSEYRGLTPEVQRLLADRDRKDIVRGEHSRDTVHLRRYRQTLLVHQECPIQREPILQVISELFVAGNIEPESIRVDLTDGVPVWFEGPQGAAVLAQNTLAKALLLRVCEQRGYPMRVEDLLEDAAAQHDPEVCGPEAMIDTCMTLRNGFQAGALQLTVDPPQVCAGHSRAALCQSPRAGSAAPG